MKLLRRQTVSDMTGMPRSTIYAAIKQGRFPRPVVLGVRAVAWRSEDIEAWINERRTRS